MKDHSATHPDTPAPRALARLAPPLALFLACLGGLRLGPGGWPSGLLALAALVLGGLALRRLPSRPARGGRLAPALLIGAAALGLWALGDPWAAALVVALFWLAEVMRDEAWTRLEAVTARPPTAPGEFEHFMRVFTPAILLLALLVALMPPMLLRASWQDWLYRGVTLVVIAMPCALAIAIPATQALALSAAGRLGARPGDLGAIETAARLTHLVLDETAPLLTATPRQVDVLGLGRDDPDYYEAIARALASRSRCPGLRALASQAPVEETGLELAAVEDLPDGGVRGVVNGLRYYLGDRRVADALGFGMRRVDSLLSRVERDGRSTRLLCGASGVLAIFAFVEQAPPECGHAVAQLREQKLRLALLSDRPAAAVTAVAHQLGIEDARGGQTDADRLDVVQTLLTPANRVAVATASPRPEPFLARADLRVWLAPAPADGSCRASVSLAEGGLPALPGFLRLARRYAFVLHTNAAALVLLKLALIGLALVGGLSPWMALLIDLGLVPLLLLNAFRLVPGARSRDLR